MIAAPPPYTGTALIVVPIFYHQKGALSRSSEERLNEAIGLAKAIHLHVVDHHLINLRNIRPSHLLGKGHVDSLKTPIKDNNITLVIIDGSLSPIQQRNLERAWQCKVIDRTGLILEIFGERAHTHEGRLQVELAALTYQRSRLVRSWTHLERQRGGFGFLGGPGETQLEIDRRLIDQRIIHIKQDLKTVKKTRTLQRRARKEVPFPIVALVGYTNAGKSTLFNHLTKANVFAENLLFATLDPTMRKVALSSGRSIILSDTVGFIADLPTTLIAAFKATLEEVLEADIILHIHDITHPESNFQTQEVEKILDELGVRHDKDTILVDVYNKIDLLKTEPILPSYPGHSRHKAFVSAITGQGSDQLLSLIDHLLTTSWPIFDVSIPFSDGKKIAWLYEYAEILQRHDQEDHIDFQIRLNPKYVKIFHKTISALTTS